MTSESRVWLILVVGAGLMWLVYLLAPVLTPFVLSAGLAFLGDPLVDRLETCHIGKWHLSRSFAVSLVFLLMIVILVATLLIIVPLLRVQIQHMVEKAPGMVEWVAGKALPWLQTKLGLSSLDFDIVSLTEALKSYWKEMSSALLSVLGTVSRSSQAMLGWLVNLVLIPVVTFYLMRDWDKLIRGIKNLLPPKVEPDVSRLAREINQVLSAFIRGQLMVMFVLGLVYAVGLWAIGLDLAFVIGMAAGVLSIVPYLGTGVGVVAGALAAIVQFGDIMHLVVVLLVFGFGQVLEGMVLTPKLVGDQVGLHPVAVIFAVLAGGQLFGLLGILLALPVASALNVLIRHAHDEYTRSSLFVVLDQQDDQEPEEA